MIITVEQTTDTSEVSQDIIQVIEIAPFAVPDGIDEAIFTEKGQILAASAASTPAAIPAPTTDGHTLIADSSYATGWKTGVPNISLTGIPNDGWVPDTNTWSYSSVDGPTGVISVNADLNDIVSKGMRVSYQQSQALTAYWTFDSSSTPDVDPGLTMGNIGTPTYTAGKFSNAFTLDGSTDALSITDHSSMKPTGSFTVGVWFKTSTTGVIQTIFQSFYFPSVNAGFYIRVNASNYLDAQIAANTGTTENVDYWQLTGSTSVSDGNWHYAVLTYARNYAQLYLDGNLIAAKYSKAAAYDASNKVRIGCSNATGTDGNWFNGQIDDLFIINGYALDEVAIRTQYLAATAQGTGNITVTKMGIVTHVGAYSGGATLLTVYHGTDYTLANATISNPYYSPVKAPLNFPTSEDKWTINFSDAAQRTQSSPTQYALYNVGSLSMDVHIGAWNLGYEVEVGVTENVAAAAGGFAASINTATSAHGGDFLDVWLFVNTAGASYTYRKKFGRTRHVRTAAKTTYYLLGSCNWSGAASLDFYGTSMKSRIFAVSAYL